MFETNQFETEKQSWVLNSNYEIKTMFEDAIEKKSVIMMKMIQSDELLWLDISSNVFDKIDKVLIQSIKSTQRTDFDTYIQQQFFQYMSSKQTYRSILKEWFQHDKYEVLIKQYKTHQNKFANVISKHTSICKDSASIVYEFL